MILFGVLFGLVTANKRFIRPHVDPGSFLAVLSGSFPNFIAAYIISMFFVNGAVTMRFRYSRMLVYTSSICVFTMLTVEELMPMWGASTCCDAYDIISSGFGALLSICTYEIIRAKQQKKSIICS